MSDFNPQLPSFLQRTPEEIQAEEARQARYRQALHGRVRRNAEERHIAQAIEVEKAIRAEVEGAGEIAVSQRARLADAVAEQGRYEEAASLAVDIDKADEYLAIHEAIERDDSEECGCKPEMVRDPLTGNMIRLPVSHVKAMVYSTKHEKLMPLHACKCGSLQVK